MDKREILCDMGYEESVVFDGPEFDDAIIGVTDEGRVVYDYDRMVETMMAADGISWEDAVDFIEYNTMRALPYFENGPIVMHRLDEELYR